MTSELLYLTTALAGGAAASRLKLPVFVGYLGVGVAFGMAGHTPDELLLQAGEAGVLLLLFGVGLHLRPRNLFSLPMMLGGFLHLAISTTVCVVAARYMGFAWGEALLWGLLLSLSSTVLAAKTLDSGGELTAFHGRVAIGILILQDIVAIAILVVVSNTATSLWSLGVVALLLAVRNPLQKWMLAINSDELQLLAAVLLALGVAELFSIVNLNPELGAITAGALIAKLPLSETLADRIWSVKELLLVGFFLSIGMRASPSVEHWELVVAFTILLPFKAWLFFALLVLLGLRARTAFLTGASLTSYSEFMLIAGASANAHGLLSSAGLNVLTLVTVISFAIHLPINRLSHQLYDRFQGMTRHFERDMSHPDEPASSIGAAQYLVLGMGRTGTAAYDFLRRRGEKVTGLDTDPEVLSFQLAAGRRVAYGDAQDRELWRALRLTSVLGAVVALPRADARLRTTELLREYAPKVVISNFAMYQHEAEQLRAAGADNVSSLLAEAGERLAELSLVPARAPDLSAELPAEHCSAVDNFSLNAKQ